MIRLLTRLHILDADGTLCLSSLLMFACLILVITKTEVWAIAALALAIVNFNAKRFFAFLRTKKELGDHQKLGAMQGEIDRLTREFEKLNAAMSFKSMRQ